MSIGKRKVKKFVPLLKVIDKLSPADQAILLEHLDDSSSSCIMACVLNGLKNPSISSDQRRILRNGWKANEKEIRYIANEKKPFKGRKKKLKQVGGSIGFLISALLPILTSLFTK